MNVDAIQNTFDLNKTRVESLVALYDKQAGKGKGRRKTKDSDLLRASVIFLHASLEEVLRGVALLTWHQSTKATLDDVPLFGSNPPARASKFFLGELVSFRGRSVDDLLRDSVAAYVGAHFNCNDTGQLAGALTRGGVVLTNAEKASFSVLETMMKRRHLIVHQADRNASLGKGQHRARSISAPLVKSWVAAVEAVVSAILTKVAAM